ncbi:unnamed protein product, partial [Mesorhabditis belari]|uniref:Uncharacterized protein n=1 Tax=Mesorhabditis belari TaxID=2138241 RepID=A0AAF3FCQ0_9BILA
MTFEKKSRINVFSYRKTGLLLISTIFGATLFIHFFRANLFDNGKEPKKQIVLQNFLATRDPEANGRNLRNPNEIFLKYIYQNWNKAALFVLISLIVLMLSFTQTLLSLIVQSDRLNEFTVLTISLNFTGHRSNSTRCFTTIKRSTTKSKAETATRLAARTLQLQTYLIPILFIAVISIFA